MDLWEELLCTLPVPDLAISGGIDPAKMDTKGLPICERLFVRPRKGVKEGDKELWRNETVGFHSAGSDPVKVANAYLKKNEKWSDHTRSLGSARGLMATAARRCGVSPEVCSAMVGHDVTAYDLKKGDKRLNDYTYAMGFTVRDMTTFHIIVTSNYSITWPNALLVIDEKHVQRMINDMPEIIMGKLFDDESRSDSKIGEQYTKPLASESTIFGARTPAAAAPTPATLPPPPAAHNAAPAAPYSHQPLPSAYYHQQPPPASHYAAPAPVYYHQQPPPVYYHQQPPPASHNAAPPPAYYHQQASSAAPHAAPPAAYYHQPPPPAYYYHQQPPSVAHHAAPPAAYYHQPSPPAYYPPPPHAAYYAAPP
jgi:hypothetical protein